MAKNLQCGLKIETSLTTAACMVMSSPPLLNEWLQVRGLMTPLALLFFLSLFPLKIFDAEVAAGALVCQFVVQAAEASMCCWNHLLQRSEKRRRGVQRSRFGAHTRSDSFVAMVLAHTLPVSPYDTKRKWTRGRIDLLYQAEGPWPCA